MLNALNHETISTLIDIGAMVCFSIGLVVFYLALSHADRLAHLRRKR